MEGFAKEWAKTTVSQVKQENKKGAEIYNIDLFSRKRDSLSISSVSHKLVLS